MFELIAFYLFAALTVASFAITITTKQPLHALTSLGAGMIFISAFFFLLGADFLGAVQIVVYTGAVVAIYAFGMMFFDSSIKVKEKQISKTPIYALGSVVAIVVFFALMLPVSKDTLNTSSPIMQNVGNTQNIGYVLFSKYLIAFEAAAVMLLVAMIAGIVLASKNMNNDTKANQ